MLCHSTLHSPPGNSLLLPPGVNYDISHLRVLGKVQLVHTRRRSHSVVAHEEAELPWPGFAPKTSPDPLGAGGLREAELPPHPFPAGVSQLTPVKTKGTSWRLLLLCHIWLRLAENSGIQSPLFLQSKQSTAVTMPMASPAQPHQGESLQQEGRTNMRVLGKLHVLLLFDFSITHLKYR